VDLQLEGRTALVTGASQGIGRAIAQAMAAEGVRVAIAARRLETLQEISEEIRATGGPAPSILGTDLYEDGAAEELALRATAELGRIDVLVNAAGGSRPLPLEAGAAEWREAMVLNFERIRELTHAVIPGMRANEWGRIINITGSSEPQGLNAANAAKAAVHAWAKGLSRELAQYGITVNSIRPGRIISEQILRMWPTEEARRKVAGAEMPIRRFGEARELAALAVFLASPVASYITGTVISVDGGMNRFAF
jgi:3-oxoacyl-[acyl-carrier protein] reductase